MNQACQVIPLLRHTSKKHYDLTNDLILEQRPYAFRLARSMLYAWGLCLEHHEIQSLSDFALCEAASRFDSAYGSQFSSYLYLYIKGEVIKYLKNHIRQNHILSIDIDSEAGHYCETRVKENELGIDENTPESYCMYYQARARCMGALKLLTPIEKRVVLEVYVNETKISSIARSIGYSRGHTSEKRKSALSKLRLELEDFLEAA